MANKTKRYGNEIIQLIISLYLEESKLNGEIEYSSVRDFAVGLYNSNHSIFAEKLYYQLIDGSTGELSEKIYKNTKLSDDFWRKPQYQGRQLIDEANKLLSKTAAKPSKRQSIVLNTDYLVESNLSNMAQLKLQLKPLEEQLNANIRLIENLEGEVCELDSVIIALKQENTDLKKKNDNLQDVLHKFFEWSADGNIPLKNLFNTGNGRMKHVEAALRTAFATNPSEFFNKIDHIGTDSDGISNIATLQEFVEKKSIIITYSDDYDFE